MTTNPTTIKTWGEALDYTWRVKWKRKNSAKTNAINSSHVTNYCGRSLPLKRMTVAGWWLEFKQRWKTKAAPAQRSTASFRRARL